MNVSNYDETVCLLSKPGVNRHIEMKIAKDEIPKK